MNAYTPPPSPTLRLPHPQRDRTRSRRTASPRLKIRRRSFTERPPTPTQRPPSPELIFSMSPTDSHFPPASPAPKAQLNPGALLARARQQSANAFAALANHQRPRQPLLYSFPKSAAHLRAPPTTGTTHAECRPARFPFSPIPESSDDPIAPEAPRSTHICSIPIPVPIPIPIPIPPAHPNSSFDSAQYSPGSFYGTSDTEVNKPVACPPKIVGFDTGFDSDDDSPNSSSTSSSRLDRFVPNKANPPDGPRGFVKPLQTRNRD